MNFLIRFAPEVVVDVAELCSKSIVAFFHFHFPRLRHSTDKFAQDTGPMQADHQLEMIFLFPDYKAILL